MSKTIGPPTMATVVTTAEFADAAGVERQFGLKRSFLYVLKDRGVIETVSLRDEGKLRGKRLFVCSSIRAYLMANIERPKGRRRSPKASSGRPKSRATKKRKTASPLPPELAEGHTEA
ncbi:MAG: hypothetical protein IT577_23365 [Verrucomicrobiae bacterium]|nr:hypothetical protein [Verrucomicrobiae bacterium]